MKGRRVMKRMIDSLPRLPSEDELTAIEDEYTAWMGVSDEKIDALRCVVWGEETNDDWYAVAVFPDGGGGGTAFGFAMDGEAVEICEP